MAAIRLLSRADLPALLQLTRAASWNQTAGDWIRLLDLEASGCFGIDVDGTLAATATVLTYTPDLAWLGMVLTLPGFRGRGFARQIVEHTLAYARGHIIRLDASDMARPLYESLGFIEECAIERWLRDPAPAPGSCETFPFEYPEGLDTEVFRANRSALINRLAVFDAAAIPSEGFALGRPGLNAAYFGPCVANTPNGARAMLLWFLARHPSKPVFWDLFPHHPEAAKLATEFGFRPVRRLTRMSLNAPEAALPDARIYAIAGFEYG